MPTAKQIVLGYSEQKTNEENENVQFKKTGA